MWARDRSALAADTDVLTSDLFGFTMDATSKVRSRSDFDEEHIFYFTISTVTKDIHVCLGDASVFHTWGKGLKFLFSQSDEPAGEGFRGDSDSDDEEEGAVQENWEAGEVKVRMLPKPEGKEKRGEEEVNEAVGEGVRAWSAPRLSLDVQSAWDLVDSALEQDMETKSVPKKTLRRTDSEVQIVRTEREGSKDSDPNVKMEGHHLPNRLS